MLNIPNESLQDYVQHIGSLGTLVPGCHLLSSVPCILPPMGYLSSLMFNPMGHTLHLTSVINIGYIIQVERRSQGNRL